MDRWLLVFVGGILSASLHSDIKFWLIFSTIALLLLATVNAFFYFRQREVKQRTIVLRLMVLFCGILWGNANLYWQNLRAIPDELMGNEIQLTLVVDEMSRRYPFHLRMTGRVEVLAGKVLPFWLQPRVQLSWYNSHHKQVPKAGERWQLEVKLKQATDYRNQGSFRYRKYLLRNNIYALGTVKDGEKLTRVISFRQRVFDGIERADLSEPGILAALTIGERSLLTSATRESWQKTGLAHSLAISGLHLGMVAGSTILFFRFCFYCFPISLKNRERLDIRLWSLVFAAIVVSGYAGMSGFSISTVRALTMFLVVLLHIVLKLKLNPLSLLLRVVAAVLVVDVFAWQDPGFWLSITAVAALFLASWRWSKSRGRFSAVKSLWSIQWQLLVVMSPLSFLLFGGFSLFAPVVNLLVLPVISFWLLPLALIGTVFALFGSDIAVSFWQLSELPVTCLTPLLDALAGHPANWLELNQWPITRAARFAVLFALTAAMLLPVSRGWQRLGLLLCLPVAAFSFFNQRDGKLRLHVLDVGQSQALVIEKDGKAMLIDTGIEFSSGFSVAEAVIEPFLNYHGLRPELAFISHGDRDHNGGRDFLRQRYPQLEWRGDASDKPCRAGDTGEWNSIQWEVLWPTSAYQDANRLSKNNRSCVLRVSYKDFSVFLPGDIEMMAEQLLLKSLHKLPEANSDVLLIPHHGSKTSTSWPLLQAVDADIYLISYGKHKGYDFPHRYTQERLSRTQKPWFGTRDSGQLTIVSDGNTWSLELPFENR
ncbi:DNA internalization-related competence protein ComEC/Rec2 [Idiomarina loihiensis]|uniref:DNA internalization-related competence protein ComEC/Rec2 n=1 Tax=Idiomarina TaxID=135575 RepID=UPI000E0E83DA|nr:MULTISPECIES: DNA internalization-related competence protein ComEC/Rec2 [Idiomarina]MBL4856928.1 DNA internalization-related competence protein ComEC/Rec2 [Idiomarina sp.]MRJ44163.1 DNA internalization-related competence protein ComEC/Rec2 [Idiomarina loihiensis]TDO53794.1 competence protein ComEC [Idiomarina sp. 017G]UTW33716.1 DNA internalization-related competence protein ComEC/Rec2 [Idiomarina loihiensis]